MTNIIAGVVDRDAVDESTRPQDDFYRHANGTWLDNHVIPADQASDGAFYQLHEQSLRDCRKLIEQCPDSRITALYQAYMDTEAIDRAGLAPLQADFAAIDAATNHRDLAHLLTRFAKEGKGGWLTFFVSAHPDNPDVNILKAYQYGLGLPERDYYFEDAHAPIRDLYVKYVEKVLELTGFDEAAARATALVQCETNLAEAHWSNVESRDATKTHNILTAAEFATLGAYDWDAVWNILGISPTIIHVYQPSFITKAAEWWQGTDVAVLQNWMRFHLVNSFGYILPAKLRQARFDFYGKALAGQEQLPERWKQAVSYIDSAMGFELGKYYVEAHFPQAAKAQMDDLVADLIQAYRESISDLQWMGDKTKALALQKLTQFTSKIGFPNKWRDYSDLQFSEDDSLLQMDAKVSAFRFREETAKIDQPVDREEWHMTPQTVNAYYSPTANEIAFPAAILQPPFFDPTADAAINYGAIGAVIGHEIGHGFDDQGAKYDGTGALKNWWTDADEAAFQARTRALIDQYSAYSPAQLPAECRVNGKLTIGENIGDLGGLTIAWKAYLNHLEKQGLTLASAPIIEGVTAAQRFFYSWARIWRSKVRLEMAKQLLVVDPHAPAEFRCNGVLVNMDAFVEAFDVVPGDGMWRAENERIRIWS
ncbi:MAG: M13 family metallopeptidase [Actinomycetaceae bacterium]|nr:M13 family metallopeptidase [Actinomycetaceae bacterium]